MNSAIQKSMQKLLVFFICFISTITTCNRSKLITPYYSMRSQALSSMQELVGWANFVNKTNECNLYGAWALTSEYTHSWRPSLIKNCFFGQDLYIPCKGKEYLVISGSLVSDRNPSHDWLADYFGLPTDFVSHVFFTPKVQNALLDFNCYIGLDNWYPGIYIRMHLPYVHTSRTLGMKEEVINGGTNDYLAGYFTPSAVSRNGLLNNFTEYAQLGLVPRLPDGVTFEPLANARFSGCKSVSTTSFAEIEIATGWNILRDQDYHLGFNFRFALPAGSKPKGLILFEPIVGNGHHWLVGAGITGHIMVWEHACKNSSLSGYVDGNVYHFITNTQIRFFDLKNKNNSRYMLAQRLALPIADGLRGSDDGTLTFSVPSAQFKSVYAPVANVSTFPVKISTAFQTDVTAMAHYQLDDMSIDFGYNFWYRSCEKVDIDPDCLPPKLVQRNWALKGDAHMFGYNEVNNEPVALSASQSEANIHTGLNFGPGKDITQGIANGGALGSTIDNPIEAFSDLDTLHSQPGGNEQINTSIPPRFIRPSSLDICSASTESTIHTLFVHFSYEWESRCISTPYIGIGGKISCAFQDNNPFKQVNVSRCPNACSASQCVSCRPCLRECLSCAICEWGVWLKGGIAY
jgi:hypothetical protein